MAAGAACRIALREAEISRLQWLNFDCVTCNNAFNCTNKFFDPYLPIHHTTFMTLRFVFKAVYSQNAHCKAFLGRKF